MNEEKAVSVIQRNWRRFIDDRRADPEMALALASAMGRRVPHYSEFVRCLLDGNLMVQVYARMGNPLTGHSCFFADENYVRLKMLNPLGGNVEAWRQQGHVIGRYRYGNVYPMISHSDKVTYDDPQTVGKFTHLTSNKGAIFVLSSQYSRYFSEAYYFESMHFSGTPFRYGMQYNCTTFVVNVMKRIMRCAIRDR